MIKFIFVLLSIQLITKTLFANEQDLIQTTDNIFLCETNSGSTEYFFDFDEIRVPQKYPGKVGYKGKNKGKYTGNIKGKNPSDVWIFPNVKSMHKEKTIHPCQFPIELAERLILSMSKRNDLIIDPYAGVGTTLIAAIKNQRRAAGSELLKKYVDIAKKRLNLLKKNKLPYRKINTPIQMVKSNSKLYKRL